MKRHKPKNVFTDETNLYLIRLITNRDAVLADTADTQLELAKVIHQRLLPWFWSFLLHSVIVIILACIFLPQIRFEKIDILSGTVTLPVIQQPEINQDNGKPQNDPNEQQNIAVPLVKDTTPSAQVPAPVLPSIFQSSFGKNIGFGSGDGNGQTDAAVVAGLNWLAKVQNKDGSWSLSSTVFSLSAPKSREDVNAATALALLAFQGYGITAHCNSPFAKAVQNGWNYLLQQQNPLNGCFFSAPSSDSNRFYTHGLCTAALCESMAMTNDESLRLPVRNAVEYCIRYQSMNGGGWRYFPDRYSPQSDVSVTGWIVLALKSGESAGTPVPPDVYAKVMQFLDRMERNGQYQYREEEPELRLSMTAEALFCRILLGWQSNDKRLTDGLPYLTAALPSFEEHYRRDVYYWFFATNLLYQCGGDPWDVWNKAMREVLVKHQERGGQDGGSWNPRQPVRDAWGVQYGRLYTTCMSLLILEVPYRYKRPE